MKITKKLKFVIQKIFSFRGKSQYYMFASLLLISFVFAIVSNKSQIVLKTQNHMQNNLDNYLYESKIIINNAIYNNKNLSYELRNYTESFITYMDSKNIDLNLLYLYTYNDKIYIVNYLNSVVLVTTTGTSLVHNQEKSIDFQKEIEINYLNKTYDFEFKSEENIEFKTLFVKNG